MNKKFLSAILFGALMVTSTGTFVSCKDYDDDIENLQSQINNLATKSDVEAKLSQLQAAIDAAKAEALKAAADADESAEIAKLEAEIAALETCKCDVDAMLAKIQDAVDADMAEYKEEINALIEKAEGLVGEVADYVTSVELVYSYYRQNNSTVTYLPFRVEYGEEDGPSAIFSYPMNSDLFQFTPILKSGKTEKSVLLEDIKSTEWGKWFTEEYGNGKILGWNVNFKYSQGYTGQLLTYKTVTEKDAVFGEDMPGEMTFTKDKQIQRTVNFVVRVSPTNAVLTKDMISLINSQGTANELVKVVDVKPYTGLLTRAESNNGLWIVTTELTEYVKDDFNAVAKDAYGSSVLFSVAVNNTLSTAAERNVISSYDLSMNHTFYTGANGLFFWVDNKFVGELNNRYDDSSISLENPGNGDVYYYELAWEGAAAVAANKLNSDGTPKEGSNSILDKDDNRSPLNAYPAVQGQPITISLDSRWSDAVSYRISPDVKGLYITLDKKANAIESAPSEWNAWNSYEIDGLNEVFEGTQAQITINGKETINDFIGFRVYAVNHDGTLVDPDGKAFYVVLGDKATEWGAVATTIVPDADDATAPYEQNSDTIAVALTKLTGADKASWSTDKIKINGTWTQPVFEPVFFDSEYEPVDVNIYGDVSEVAWKDIKYVAANPVRGIEWYQYGDNTTYAGKLTIKNKAGHVLATLNVSMTKELPNMPIGYALKDKQVINGIYNCYMLAHEEKWKATEAEYGTMPIENLIYFGQGQADQYQVFFAESADDADDDGVLETEKPYGNQAITVAAKYVDNTTEHATVVYYNYGPISSAQWAAYVADPNNVTKDYIVTGDEFNTVYNCFYKPEVHTWAWATREQLAATYPNANPSWTAKDEDGNYEREIPAMELTYGTEFELPNKATIDMYIFGANSIDKTFSAPLAAPYEESLKVVEAKLYSDATNNEDYFDVQINGNKLTFKVIKKDLGSNPKEDVPYTLAIKCVDSYNHEVLINLPMTVKPRKN